MGEVITFKEAVRMRARAREHALTVRCLAILEECHGVAVTAYHAARPRERFVRAHKIRTLEELIAYTEHVLGVGRGDYA